MNDELSAFVRQSRAAGVDSSTIRKSLTDAGWAEGDVEAALNDGMPASSSVANELSSVVPTEVDPATQPPKKQPAYVPVLMGLSNFIFPGGAYLVLHKYTRFFIVYLMLFVLAFELPLLCNLVILAMAADTFIQARKISATTIRPKKIAALSVAGWIIVFLFMVTYAVIPSAPAFFARTETGCKMLYALNSSVQIKCIADAQSSGIFNEMSASRKNMTTDPECEAYLNDATLKFGQWQSQTSFKEFCYFKKAVETKDGKYCAGAGIDASSCLFYLAATTQDQSYCDLELSIAKERCLAVIKSKNIEDIFYSGKPSCDSFDQTPDAIKNRCHSLFGDFINKLVL